MDKFFLPGKKEYHTLNNHLVMVIAPRRRRSYEEGVKRIDHIIAQIKKEQATQSAS